MKKVISGLSKKGELTAKEFFLKFHKNAYKSAFNMDVAIQRVSDSVAERNLPYFELNQFDTLQVRPEELRLENDDLTFEEIDDETGRGSYGF